MKKATITLLTTLCATVYLSTPQISMGMNTKSQVMPSEHNEQENRAEIAQEYINKFKEFAFDSKDFSGNFEEDYVGSGIVDGYLIVDDRIAGFTEKQQKEIIDLILKMTWLTELIVMGSYFPTELTNLTNVRDLSIRDSKIESIPKEIKNFLNLENLIMVYNKDIVNLPMELCQLENLKNLTLFSNNLTELPENFGNLSHVEKIDLRNNQLSHLPASFGNLQQLKELNLSDNKLMDLPENFGNLSHVETINLQNNQLSHLTASFGNLQQLKELNLSDNKLMDLPENFGNLSHVETINLQNNQLSHLTASFGNLHQLKKLDMSNNQLAGLPSTIDQLKNLSEMILINNKISKRGNGKDLWGEEEVRKALPKSFIAFHKSEIKPYYQVKEVNMPLSEDIV